MEFGFEPVCDQPLTCLRPDSVIKFGLKKSAYRGMQRIKVRPFVLAKDLQCCTERVYPIISDVLKFASLPI